MTTLDSAPWTRELRAWALLWAALGVGIFASLTGREVRSGAFLIGDCPYYASAAVSLWEDGDLDLSNQIRGGLALHQKQIALGRDGAWVPKHPVLMPALSVPFYALFGVAGFLVFNVVTILLLASVVYATARHYLDLEPALAATGLVFAATFLRAYVYNYSPDLLATLLVLSGILLVVKRRPVAGGGFLGIAVLAKVTNLFVAALVVGFLVFRRGGREAAWAAVGIVPGLAAWMLVNLALFGGPAVTGYDRTLVLQDGVAQTVSHKGFFDLPLLDGMSGQLLDPRVGLLTTSPILLLAIPGFVIFLRRHPWDAALFLGISEFLFLLFSTYRWWATSHYGNRFLMLPVVLAAVPMAFALQVVIERIRAVGLRYRAEAASGSR
jgi:hypothetical protein